MPRYQRERSTWTHTWAPCMLTHRLHALHTSAPLPVPPRLHVDSHMGSIFVHTRAPWYWTAARWRAGGRDSPPEPAPSPRAITPGLHRAGGQVVAMARAERVLPPAHGHAVRPVALATTETSLAALRRALASLLHFSSEVGIAIALARRLASDGAIASDARWRWGEPVARLVRRGHRRERRRGWPLPRTGVGFVADFHLLWMRGPWVSSWRIQSRPARACWHRRSSGVESSPPGFHRVMTWQARHRIVLVGES